MCKNLIHKHYSSYFTKWCELLVQINSIYKQSRHEQIVEMSNNEKNILKWVLAIAKHKETNEQEEYFGIGERV